MDGPPNFGYKVGHFFENFFAFDMKPILLLERIVPKQAYKIEIGLFFQFPCSGLKRGFIRLAVTFRKSPITPSAVLNEENFPFAMMFCERNNPERFFLPHAHG